MDTAHIETVVKHGGPSPSLGTRESGANIQAEVPHNEVERLAALEAYRILDTGPEPAFDELTATEKIFAPFKRLHSRESYDGTGIGLSIAKKAVARHQGSIWVESSPGEGSHFKFHLPGIDGAPQSSCRVASLGQEPPRLAPIADTAAHAVTPSTR